MTEQKTQPPQYWFALMLEAMSGGDMRAARQADEALRNAGIEVSLRKSVPVSELVKNGGQTW